SEREFQPQFSQSEWNFATNRMTSIYALALRKDVADPFAPLSDEVKIDDDKKKDEDKKDDVKKDDAKKDDTKKDKKKDKPKEPIKIDFDGLGSRVSRAPIEADNLDGVSAVKGNLIFIRRGAAYYGRDSEAKPVIKIYDLEKRKESTLVENAGNYAIS